MRLHDEAERARPDPAGRLRRIRGIRQGVGVRPLPRDLRRVLSRFCARDAARLGAHDAMAAADALSAGDATVQLWALEAAISRRDLAAATRALANARAFGADRVRLALARARLLEALGRARRAGLVVLRASTRFRGDRRLRSALRAVGAATDAAH